MNEGSYRRLMARVCMIPEAGCWLFIGALKSNGYGDIWHQGRVVGAHRLAHELFIGPVPDGVDVCHRCDVRSCVNPHHLFLGTRADNMADCSRKGRVAKPACKLTPDQVNEIRRSTDRVADLAVRFGLSQSSIFRVKNGKQYWWVPRV
jgi:hypothetical protein